MLLESPDLLTRLQEHHYLVSKQNYSMADIKDLLPWQFNSNLIIIEANIEREKEERRKHQNRSLPQ